MAQKNLLLIELHMEDILLIHRKSNRIFQSIPEGALHWKTCLRQFVFLPEQQILKSEWADELDFSSDDLLLQGEAALQELIEVLCGLHSPIVGETEVFGQFKIFIEQSKIQAKWLQFILAEVKKVRSQHMIGLGAHSYGSLLRKNLKSSDSISMIGSGHLSLEILPWLAQKKSLHIACRQPQKMLEMQKKYSHLQVTEIQTALNWLDSLIIAAPISDQQIVHILKTNLVHEVYDLRGEENSLVEIINDFFPNIKIVPLKGLFAELEQCRTSYHEKMQQIKSLIQLRSIEYFQRTELRPLGWDDLCA